MASMKVKSEVSGHVWKVLAGPGSRVAAGDTIMLVESMKMEIPVLAEAGGVVSEILVTEKAEVAEGQTVAILES